MPLIFLEICTVPNNMVCFVRDWLVIYSWSYFIFRNLLTWDALTFILFSCNNQRYVKFRHFEPQSYFISSYDTKKYLKLNVIIFPPLNNFPYHFINIGFTFILIFLQIFGLSSWYFSSHRNSFRFITSFLFCTSHWLLCSFWSNKIPWYWVACAIHKIVSLRVNHNIIHCIVIIVWKTAQGLQVIISTCN